ncbi:MAG: class I SAM-dependent methyltransferase [Candidatus Hydrogenedentota bacterium]
MRGGAPEYQPEYFGVDRLKRFAPFLALRLGKMRRALRQGKILDYGCGSGECALYLKEQGGYDAWGFDPNLVRESENLTREWNRVVAEQPFDLIMFWHSLEHLDDPCAVLKDAVSALKPGGKIFVSVPHFGSAQSKAGAMWFHLDLPRHRWQFDRISLSELLRRVGLKPVFWFERSWEYDPAGWLGTWWNRLLPRRNAFYMAWKGNGARDFSFLASLLSLPILAPLALLRTLLPDGGATLEVVAERER